MLRLPVITALLAVATATAAQKTFYCNDHNPVTVANQNDFYLVTRRPSESGYSSGLSCEFNAESVNSAFLVEIESFRVRSAVLSIKSGGQTLFSGSSIPDYQTSIVTPSKSLRVEFNANGDHTNSEGVKIRVRALTSNGCPSGWTYLYGECFGTNNIITSLDFFDAQRSCNSMRANLLQLPSSYYGNLHSFMRQLPYSLRADFTWVGLTDRTSRYNHYWLNGVRETRTSEISCASSGSYFTCYSYERCGAMYDRLSSSYYAIYMDDCSDNNRFACSMPPGGATRYYIIPGLPTTPTPRPYVPYVYVNYTWIWFAAFGSMFVVGLIVVGVHSGMRSRNIRRAATANSVVVSAGRVTVAPPAGSYQVQVSATAYPATSSAASPPYPSGGAPPAYDAAVAGGYSNTGYQK